MNLDVYSKCRHVACIVLQPSIADMQAAAVARGERQRDAAKRKERVCRLAICAAAVAAPFVFFYSIGSY